VLVLQGSGSVATKLSYGGKFFILVMSHFFLIPTLKEFFKNRPTFAKVTVKIKVAQFFDSQCIIVYICENKQTLLWSEIRRVDGSVRHQRMCEITTFIPQQW